MTPPNARPPAHELPADVELVIIDGDNLLHRVRGTRDEAGLRWLLPRLRAWLPPDLQVIVMLDGHAEPGSGPRSRVAPRIEFHHSGSLDGDGAIVRHLGTLSYGARIRSLVVTDDRSLSDRSRRAGATTRRLEWLVHQIALVMSESRGGSPSRPGRSGTSGPGATHPSGPAGTRPVGVGAGRSPRPLPRRDPLPRETERKPWSPGRGATRKRGNPRRGTAPP